MSVPVLRSPENVQQLLSERWLDVQRVVGSLVSGVQLSLEIGHSEHFRSPRGYATTKVLSPSRFHITFSDKVLRCSVDRLDALIRHELGHVIDFATDREAANRWARSRGIDLPPTPERRADAVAFAVWRQMLRYDADEVQSLTEGAWARPEHLGL